MTPKQIERISTKQEAWWVPAEGATKGALFT